MRLPVIRGLIDRRLLVNYRAQPEMVERLLPAPFRPQVVGGYAIVGLCLIRLRHVRPAGFPAWVGIYSENAAHRVAVQWLDNGVLRNGVYILRRDTNARLNVLVGGRIFPGVHHFSAFSVRETDERMQVAFTSFADEVNATIDVRHSTRWPWDSAFPSLHAASAFFECASLGYSPSRSRGRLQGLELRCQSWHAESLDLVTVRSSFFDDTTRFPPGTITLDSGLMMRGIEHQWHTCGDLCVDDEAIQAATDASSATQALTTSP